MKKYICLLVFHALCFSGISQNLKQKSCVIDFNLVPSKALMKKNEILIYKFQPDSIKHYALYKTIHTSKSKFKIEFSFPEDFSGYIDWKINDTIISTSGTMIFSNEKINILFKEKAIEVRSDQNDFFNDNCFLLFALPSTISKDNTYSISRVKKSYEISIPENYTLEMKIREHERNILKSLKSNKKYYHSLRRIDAVKEQISPKTLDTCIFLLSPYFHNSSLFQKILIYSIQTKKLSIGKKIMSFCIQDTTMKSICSDSFYAKHEYTLIDFWASWCKPCREKTPNLIKQFQLADTSKFQIISISIDTDKSNWLKAINEDKIKWKNYIDQTTVGGKVIFLKHLQLQVSLKILLFLEMAIL